MNDLRTKMLGVKLTEKEYNALSEYCNALGIKKSEFIRTLIHKELFE